MLLTAIKTHKITRADQDILKIVDKYLPAVKERSVVAVTSKIVAIAEGRLINAKGIDKDELIKRESQLYIPRSKNKYNVSLTITSNNLVATAGIDESNGNGYYILWPENPQQSANKIRKFIREKFNLKEVGVIITDSRTTPMRWGVTAMSIGYSGFEPLKDYIGTPDIFDKMLHVTKMSIIDNLACSAALVMGEGNEQTPLCLIEDIPNIVFQENDPTEAELEAIKIEPESDLYGTLIANAPWEKGGKL